MFDIPSVYLPDILAGHARTRPDKLALVCDDGRLTWRELADAVDSFARFLGARGIGRGDRVAILAEPSLRAFVAEFGALRAGACVASLSGMASQEALARMIADSEPRMLAVDDRFLAALPAGATADLRLALGDHGRDGWLGHAEALAEGERAGRRPFPRIEPDDEFVIIYSSGTTGVPKGIVLSHACRLANCWTMAVEKRYDDSAVVFSATALYSNTTWTLATLAVFVGGTLIAMGKFDGGRALALMAEWRVSHTVLVPAALRMILDCAGSDAADLTSVRTLCTTGSAMPPELKRRVIERLPNACYEIYGLTEGFALIRKPQDGLAHLESVGKPLLGNEIRIIDDAGRDLPPGEKGEIIGYSPFLMRGYHRRPEATEEAIWREPGTGRTFLRSGDIGYFDDHGFLHLVDRKKDMLVSGGYNVYPADIERVLATHAAVIEVAVIGVPHEKWGETPFAYVVAREGAAEVSEDALKAWLNVRVGKHERVAGVRLVSALPRNAGGKVLKRVLREAHERAMDTVR